MAIFIAMAMLAKAQSFTLRGRVSDPNNNPIELATVSCPTQGKVAVTSLKGEFRMTLHSADTVIVRISMLGYKTKTRTLTRPKGAQTLQVTLYENVEHIGEVNVVRQKIQ